jgi:pyruvate formate lyase activating enzyme
MPLNVLDNKEKLQQFKTILHQHSAPAAEALIERKENGDIQCFACGHRCLVKPGRDGVCRVRFNDNGTLLVPHGYVGPLACDPIEKKPFFHVLPGSDALTFGMLGCDYHCGYCFTPDTMVITNRGEMRFDELFNHANRRLSRPDGQIGFFPEIEVVLTLSATGVWRQIEKVFQHPYYGLLRTIRLAGMPALRCTPEHRVFVTHHPEILPRPMRASELTTRHYLASPRTVDDIGLTDAGPSSRRVSATQCPTSQHVATMRRQVIQSDQWLLHPVQDLSDSLYSGPVYNMQVDVEHTYLAEGMAVSNCQNWVTSQMLRDPNSVAQARLVKPQDLVNAALQHKAPIIASSYNEPLITSEWAVDVFKVAKQAGLRCAYISNGNGTPQVLDFIRPYVEAYKVDLKTFDPKHYRQLGGVMENVTDTIKNLKARGFWVEIVTLVVPGFSDHPDDLKRMAEFLAGVDPLMPWHMTAFHPDYKMTDGYRSTVVDDLLKVYELGKAAGMKYLYPGNLPGQVGDLENTRCHRCGALLISRYGFMVTQNRMNQDGLCPDCHNPIPGIWGKASGHGDGRVRAIL